MRVAFARIRSAFHAALIPMGTTSSWFPSVGTDCTLAGVARIRQSATSAAAAIWGVKKPEFLPRPPAMKAGIPEDRSGFMTPQIAAARSEEHTSELQSRPHLGGRLLLGKKKHVI